MGEGSAFALLLASTLLLAACSSSRISAENDRLRDENLALKSQVETLTATNAELSAKLHEASASRPTPIEGDALAALPRVSSLEFDALTGYAPGDRTKPATSVNVYLRPLDGRRRFTQAVGSLAVEAFLIPAGVANADAVSDTQPRAQLSRHLAPLELRDTYRSGLTGTHYEIALPFEAPLEDRSATILIRVEFTDAVTGVVHKAERLVKPAKT